MADVDREFVSQYGTEDVGISITVGPTPTDPDGNSVNVTMVNTDTQATLFTRVAIRMGVGQYQITLTPDDTTILGNYTLTWVWQLSGDTKTYNAYIAIGGSEPAYDNLGSDFKEIVDRTWIRMADMYDSPSGGPNLQTWIQANFNKGRVAQCLWYAMGRLNTDLQPNQTYAIDGTGPAFPFSKGWGYLLERLLWIEVMKHLQRSYLEQPEVDGNAVTLYDRQRYYDRWGEQIDREEEAVKDAMSNFKIQAMFLGRPSIIVGGGIYGRYAAINQPQMRARPRLWYQAGF